jgi:hypothetical protein
VFFPDFFVDRGWAETAAFFVDRGVAMSVRIVVPLVLDQGHTNFPCAAKSCLSQKSQLYRHDLVYAKVQSVLMHIPEGPRLLSRHGRAGEGADVEVVTEERLGEKVLPLLSFAAFAGPSARTTAAVSGTKPPHSTSSHVCGLDWGVVREDIGSLGIYRYIGVEDEGC